MSTGHTEKVSQRRFQMLSMWQNAVLTSLMLTITESRGLMAHYEKGKVQRGWKSYQTPLAERKRIQYNFVKPHMALKGETPAKKAGIEIDGKTNGKHCLKIA